MRRHAAGVDGVRQAHVGSPQGWHVQVAGNLGMVEIIWWRPFRASTGSISSGRI